MYHPLSNNQIQRDNTGQQSAEEDQRIPLLAQRDPRLQRQGVQFLPEEQPLSAPQLAQLPAAEIGDVGCHMYHPPLMPPRLCRLWENTHGAFRAAHESDP